MATQADYDRLGSWALMLNPDTNIDRHTSHRTVPMQVLSLGASRTGTFSMQDALATLNYPNPYHFASVTQNAKDADMWREALAYKFHSHGPRIDWRQHFDALLGHCAAITDSPAVLFWQELVHAYPEAKIVLVERDEENWVRSIQGLIDGSSNPIGRYLIRFTDPLWFGRISNLGIAWQSEFFGGADAAQMKRNARAAYRRHYAEICAGVPKERMLEYRLGSGWEPRCAFLGKEVPDVPFPRQNEAAALERAFGLFMGKALKHSAWNAAVVVGVTAVLASVVWRWVG